MDPAIIKVRNPNSLGKGSLLGHGQRVLQILSLNTLVDLTRVPKHILQENSYRLIIRALVRIELEKIVKLNVEEPQEFPIFVGWRKRTTTVSGPRNVCVDLKYDVLCFCGIYPLQSEEVMS